MGQAEVGAFYLMAQCQNTSCGRAISVRGPFDEERLIEPVSLPPTIENACPHCGQVGRWTPQELWFMPCQDSSE